MTAARASGGGGLSGCCGLGSGVSAAGVRWPRQPRGAAGRGPDAPVAPRTSREGRAGDDLWRFPHAATSVGHVLARGHPHAAAAQEVTSGRKLPFTKGQAARATVPREHARAGGARPRRRRRCGGRRGARTSGAPKPGGDRRRSPDPAEGHAARGRWAAIRGAGSGHALHPQVRHELVRRLTSPETHPAPVSRCCWALRPPGSPLLAGPRRARCPVSGQPGRGGGRLALWLHRGTRPQCAEDRAGAGTRRPCGKQPPAWPAWPRAPGSLQWFREKILFLHLPSPGCLEMGGSRGWCGQPPVDPRRRSRLQVPEGWGPGAGHGSPVPTARSLGGRSLLLCAFPAPLDFHAPCCSPSCGGGSRPPALALHVPLRSLSLEWCVATAREPGGHFCRQEPRGACQAGSDRAKAPRRRTADMRVLQRGRGPDGRGGATAWRGHLGWL